MAMNPLTPSVPEPRSVGNDVSRPDAAHDEPIVIPPLIVEAIDTFIRDLPSLLPTHEGQWVAYNGSRRLGFEKDDLVLHRRCGELGLGDEEYLVFHVESGADMLWRGPLYFPYPFLLHWE